MKLSTRAASLYRVREYGKTPAIDGVEIVPLDRHVDDGGSLVELVRLEGGSVKALEGFELAQATYCCIQPGAVKAFHVHRVQTDVWFVRPEDRVLLVLADVREGSRTEGSRLRTLLGDGRASLVRIPPGIAHGCRNLGERPASIVYFTDRPFSADPDRCDEGRLPWDFAGEEVWDVEWE